MKHLFALALYNTVNGQLKVSPYFYECQLDCMEAAHDFNILQHKWLYTYEAPDVTNDIAYIFHTSSDELGRSFGLIEATNPAKDGDDFVAAQWAYKTIAEGSQPHLEFYDHGDEVITSEMAEQAHNNYLLELERNKLTLFAMSKLREQVFSPDKGMAGENMS